MSWPILTARPVLYYQSRCFIGQRNFNLSIKASGPEKSWVQRVWAVGSHDHFDLKCEIIAV